MWVPMSPVILRDCLAAPRAARQLPGGNAMTETKPTRLVWMDLLRIFCIFTVIIIHVSGPLMEQTFKVGSTAWQQTNALASCVRFSVPVLVMISGAFFLDPNRPCPGKKLFGQKLVRVLTAWLLWSVVYAAVMWGRRGYNVLQGETVGKIFDSAFRENYFHLWFLPMIAGLYLTVPLLRKITADEKATKYFIAVGFVADFVFAQLPKIEPIRPYVYDLVKNASLFFFYGFSVFFAAGYYFTHYEVRPWLRRLLYALAVCSCIVTACVTAGLSLKKGELDASAYASLLPNTAVTSFAVFLFFKNVVSKIRWSDRAARGIAKVSAWSFGVYLVHVLVREFMVKNLGITGVEHSPLWFIPVSALGIFLVSLLLSVILNHIPFLRKYIV